MEEYVDRAVLSCGSGWYHEDRDGSRRLFGSNIDSKKSDQIISYKVTTKRIKVEAEKRLTIDMQEVREASNQLAI